MSTISQTIPNLLLGISQQPDNRKRPGQVKDAVNAFPDFALGMLKRPGGKFVSKLDGATATGKWFPILRDGTEKYIGQYNPATFDFRVWNLSDGHRTTLDMSAAAGQPNTCNIADVLTKTANVSNAKQTLATSETALQTAGADLAKKIAGQIPVVNKLFATDFRQLSNPRAQDYADSLKESLKSGVIENEETARQATATVSVTNTITDVGVSAGGSGYTSAPAVTIAGSGSNATATAVLSDTGDLSSINIINAGAEYIDVPTVTFGGGLAGYQGTAVVNWFTKQVTKVLVEDGDVINLTDESERYELTGNIGKRESLYGDHDGDFEGQDLFDNDNDKIGYNTGRPSMTFCDGSALTTGPLGIYLNSRDLTGKSKIRIMAVTGNRDFIPGQGTVVANGTAPATGVPTIDGGNGGTYLSGTYNGGLYNDTASQFNSLGIPTLDVYIAKEGVTSIDNQGNVNPVWNGSQPAGGPPDSQFINALSRFSGATDWRHIGEIIPASPAGNTDKPYYLSEYEFNIPADLQTTGCYICIGASSQNPAIGQADSSNKFAVTTLTLLNAAPTTTNIADSTVTFNVNPKSANAQSFFTRWNTRHGFHPHYSDKLLLFRNGTVTPTAPTTTAVADVILGKSVADLTLTNAGSGYNVGQATTISLTGGNPTVAATPTITLTPTFTGTITEAGLGYVTPTATLSGGGGADATVAVTASKSKVTGFTFTGGNSNYTSNPTITISAPDLEGAQFAKTLIKKDGVVLDGAANFVTIKQMGQGLTAVTGINLPTTTNGKGTGITVDLTVAGGQVTAASINGQNKGTGYYTGDELYITGYTDVVLRVEGIARGTERTDEHPVLASTGYRVYEAEETIAPANTPAELTAAETAYTTALTNHTSATTSLTTAQTALTTAQGLCTITSQPNDWYLKDAAAEDIEVLTVNDYTFVVNKTKEVAMSATTTHPNLDANRAVVVVQVASNSTLYQVNLTRGNTLNSVPITSASSAANSGTIANQLGNAINNLNVGYVANVIGPSIVITHPTEAFKVSVQGGISNEAIFAFTDSVSNVSLLPLHCKDGYVVKVTNAADVDIDDMYVEFTANNGAGFGVGQWTETTEPGITYEIDPKTMPHALVNTAAGKFELQSITWNDRIVGDDTTNPKPSFVGGKISNVFFYRGRMGILSGQNVILSQAGDIFNFWAQTARTSVAADPIDISAAGKKPVFLNYVAPTSVGLVLYSSNEQFILTTDADVLTPTSTKINQLSAYECDGDLEAVALGTSQALITKTPLFTRVFELSEINADQPPVMQDITNVVPELIPQSVDSMVASPALSIVSLGEQGKPDIYQYRFLNTGRDERELNSWYRWKLTGNLLGQFFESSTWYAVVSNGADVYVQSFDMTQSNEQGFLTLPTGEKTDVCLDLFDTNPHRTYDSATDKTKVFLPYNDVPGSELNVVVLGGYIGDTNTAANQSVGSVLKPTTGITPLNVAFTELDGDLRGRDVIIGYNYNMEIELPEIFKYKVEGNNVSNDDVSSLILHRLKFKTGLSGPVDYKISITGREDWDNAVSVTQPNQYTLNNVNMQAKATHVVPVFQRNENLAVKIIGNTPFPVSLLGLDWEGKFNPRFYRRG